MPPAERTQWPAAPAPQAALRLGIARALAWALLLGGWLVLGALGHDAARGGARAALPLAAWLATIGLALAAAPRLRLPMPVLAAGVVAAALLAAAPLLAPLNLGTAALAAAPGWALLLVLASRQVRALRGVQARPVPAPLGPACAGAVAAWLLAGDPLAVAAQRASVAAALGAAALALVVLMPRRAAPVAGCRAGLFDCSLPLPWGAGWRVAADWPLHAAALAMLPMMAALPAMAAWCAGPGVSVPAVTALHLSAMLGPAWLLRPLLPRVSRAALRAVVASLLAAGAVSLLVGQAREALLLGTLLHALAWSLAWATPMLARDGPPRRVDGAAAPLAAALVATAGVTGLAAAMAWSGAQALREAHLALAALGLGGLAWATLAPRPRRERLS